MSRKIKRNPLEQARTTKTEGKIDKKILNYKNRLEVIDNSYVVRYIKCIK